jgi:hypothetical protein
MESTCLIESSCFLRNGVHKNGTYPDDFGSLERAQKCISEKAATEALASPRVVDGQAAKDHHRDRFGHVAPHSARRARSRNCAGRK